MEDIILFSSVNPLNLRLLFAAIRSACGFAGGFANERDSLSRAGSNFRRQFSSKSLTQEVSALNTYLTLQVRNATYWITETQGRM